MISEHRLTFEEQQISNSFINIQVKLNSKSESHKNDSLVLMLHILTPCILTEKLFQ